MASELIYRRHDASPPEFAEKYTPKSEKSLIWLSRSLRYFFRQQRPLFLLFGMALAALFFLLSPRSSPYPLDSDRNMWMSTEAAHSYGAHHSHRAAIQTASRGLYVGGKIPLGLKRKGLRVVVTGGAGFVGSHLVDRLIARGDSVIVVDNFFTGRKENVMHHFGNPNFELVRHDVVEPILLEVDQIYHLACPASPVHYKFNPVKTIISFFIRFFNHPNLLISIVFPLITKLLTSSYFSWMHLSTLFLPLFTSSCFFDLNCVRSCYDEGKRTAETLTMDYHRGAQVEVRIARIFNTYGPRMCIDDGRVVSNFVAQALRKEPLTVYGDGKQTRSFQYVSDLVEGLMRLMEGEHIGPFNLGNPGEFTMLELASVVQDTIDPNAKIEFRPNTEDDPHKRKPDITRAKQLLGWEPKISLRQGLPLMVSDFRQRIFGDQSEAAATTSTGAD
ncbi:hypothetical protein ZIOFF_041586 [Zingiber officinale]|uniref:UDP-glucuronic acid decarboxylase 1 n=1 Tax=Zingiber officinale TaxID=94328 RepID=A0A8J5GHP4_ZINOF|nr:hypothetical protein ZIOFF_041586 [Zingiber officinale]